MEGACWHALTLEWRQGPTRSEARRRQHVRLAENGPLLEPPYQCNALRGLRRPTITPRRVGHLWCHRASASPPAPRPSIRLELSWRSRNAGAGNNLGCKVRLTRDRTSHTTSASLLPAVGRPRATEAHAPVPPRTRASRPQLVPPVPPARSASAPGAAPGAQASAGPAQASSASAACGRTQSTASTSIPC